MYVDYTRVEYLEINYSTSSTSVIHMRGNNTLLSRCIVKGNNTNTLSGVYTEPGANNTFVDNCLIFHNYRAAYIQNVSSGTKNAYFDYCTFVDNDISAASSSYSNIYFAYATNAKVSYVYNVAMGLAGAVDISVESSTSSNLTHSGSNNAWDIDTTYFYSSTGSYTSSQDISSGGVTTTTTTANAMIVTSLTSGSEDYTPVPATGAGSNLLLGNGVNRQGSEPDPRQDFSTDIRGAARPTTAGKIDIGAFQITTAAGFKYWDGAAWADSTAVQYWNGSAWTDVTGIQYWNGSAWTDPS